MVSGFLVARMDVYGVLFWRFVVKLGADVSQSPSILPKIAINQIWSISTLPETKIAPENRPFQKEMSSSRRVSVWFLSKDLPWFTLDLGPNQPDERISMGAPPKPRELIG